MRSSREGPHARTPSPMHTHTHTTPRPAVMALVGELDEDDLVYVKREVEERLGSLGR